MDGVEALSLALGEMHLPHRGDAEAFFLEAGNNLANEVLLDGVGLDDRKGALHGVLQLVIWRAV